MAAAAKAEGTATIPLASKDQRTALQAPMEHDTPTGEEVVKRLNDTLGFYAWSFTVVDARVNADSDEAWVRGILTWHQRTGDSPNHPILDVNHEAFGAKRISRMEGGKAYSVTQDMQSARMIALRNAAMDFGIGLDQAIKTVRERIDTAAANRQEQKNGQAKPVQQQQQRQVSAGQQIDNDVRTLLSPCALCGNELREVEFKSGDNWSAETLGRYGMKKFGRALCMDHYKQAGERERNKEPHPWSTAPSEDMLEELPF